MAIVAAAADQPHVMRLLIESRADVNKPNAKVKQPSVLLGPLERHSTRAASVPSFSFHTHALPADVVVVDAVARRRQARECP